MKFWKGSLAKPMLKNRVVTIAVMSGDAALVTSLDFSNVVGGASGAVFPAWGISRKIKWLPSAALVKGVRQ